jgi:hypothetical protein
MWGPSSDRLDNLLNLARGQKQTKNRGQDENAVPDLLADNGHLSKIGYVRDSVRRLLHMARAYDREDLAKQLGCEADIRRFVMLLCGRIIGGQRRDLTERDRLCLYQVLGFEFCPVREICG